MPTRVETAGPEDLRKILVLFDGVQGWLVSRGLEGQWGTTPFSTSEAQRERFSKWIESGCFYVVRDSGEIVGTMVLSEQAPDYAQDGCAGRAAACYLEALAVHRNCAGRGVGSALLSWAEQEALARGLSVVRLDCWAGNPSLRAYYRRAGFAEVAVIELGTWEGVLFEKSL